MLLTLDQIASRLGKSQRQIRYLIKTGRLQAQKSGGRWFIDTDDLELSDGQQKSLDRRQRQLRAAVEEGLQLADEEQPKRYSLLDLVAFQLTMPLQQQSSKVLGAEHPATVSLHSGLKKLAIGCHRYEYADKAEAYRQARDDISIAVCELLLSGNEQAAEIATQIEQDVMAALAGLIRNAERKYRQ